MRFTAWLNLKVNDPLLDPLNPEQRRAASHGLGPMLILAGAGSGKTRTVTHRIAYLIREGLARPEKILAVTFTKKAAEEMRERAFRLIGEKNAARRTTICTFHSLCARILRQYPEPANLDKNFTIYDTDDQKRLIKTIAPDSDQYSAADYAEYISRQKENLMPPSELPPRDPRVYVYEAYEKKLRENNAVDFSGLLLSVVVLFQKDERIRDALQERWAYMFVDEFQDTNYSQFIICRYLSGLHGNLCVVGDDDQSIYSWRGANIENILDFPKHFPETAVFKLEQNYRSSGHILFAASTVISHNTRRTEKKLWSQSDDGTPVTVYYPENNRQEAEFVADIIEKCRLDGTARLLDFAVFYRTNAQSRVIEDTFRRRGIPYRIFGGVRFYERQEIKDLLAFLKSSVNPRDDVSLLRIINVPPRRIGKALQEKIKAHAAAQGVPLLDAIHQLAEGPLSEQNRKALSHFLDIIRHVTDEAANGTTLSTLTAILLKTAYTDYVEAHFKESGPERLLNIDELFSVVTDFEKEAADLSVTAFLEELLLNEAISEENAELPAYVSMMTLHAAKGLEFSNVFIVGLCENLLPHFSSRENSAEIEEERRLFYVGITRAKENLVITSPRRRFDRGSEVEAFPSPFLAELPNEAVNIIGQSNDSDPIFHDDDDPWDIPDDVPF